MLKQTHTYALLAVPPAIHRIIRETLIELGNEHRMELVENDEGVLVAGIEMNGIMLVPGVEDNRDLITSGDVADLSIAIGEDAFLAGFKACSQWFNQPYDTQAGYAAWSNYDPPEHLKGGI